MSGSRYEFLLDTFVKHMGNGGDPYVDVRLENPNGFEIDIHFGANMNSLRQAYRQIKAGERNSQDPGLTLDIVQKFTDAGFLWESTRNDSRGRKKGQGNPVPRTGKRREIYTAAIREYRRLNPEEFPLRLQRSRSGSRKVPGTRVSITFEGVYYPDITIGNFEHNLKVKLRQKKMTIEEYNHWIAEGLNLPEYSS